MKEIIYKFGERTKALRFNESGNIGVDLKSIELSERAQEIARRDKISFGLALTVARSEMPGAVQFNETGGLRVDPRSVELNERAKEIAGEDGVNFGEALRRARHEMPSADSRNSVTRNFSDFKSQWIEIFRAGDYGEKGEWTPEDLDQVVRNFSAGIWTPPAVFGHPKDDSPAHGWVSALKREGDVLLAQFTQVTPQLESSAKEGRFPNRSAAFYLDPKGSGPVLRHVGFLGATPPEVKSLRPIAFRESEFTEIDFAR